MNNTAWYTYIDKIVQGDKVDQHNNLLYSAKASADCENFELAEEMLHKAAEFSRVELIGKLFEEFPRLSGKAIVNYAMNDAARHGKIKALQALLRHRCEGYSCDTALETAAARGYARCVEALIPMANCLIGDSCALRQAAARNHLECVKILLAHSNPLARHCEALQYAASHQNEEMLKLLYPLHSPEQVQHALEYMQNCVGQEFNQEDVDYLQQWHTNKLLGVALQEQCPIAFKVPKKI